MRNLHYIDATRWDHEVRIAFKDSDRLITRLCFTDTMHYLLEARTEGGRNEDDLFRYHVLNAVGILGGSTIRDPIYYR